MYGIQDCNNHITIIIQNQTVIIRKCSKASVFVKQTQKKCCYITVLLHLCANLLYSCVKEVVNIIKATNYTSGRGWIENEVWRSWVIEAPCPD
jgi:hypothetical protein